MIASWPLSRSGSPSWRDRVGVDDLRRPAGQRQRQHLRDVAHAGTDQQAADALVVDLGGVDLDDRRRQAVDRPRGADPDIARARTRRRRRRQRDRAGHLAGERMDQPAVIFVPAGIERRQRGRRDLVPLRLGRRCRCRRARRGRICASPG